MNDNNVPDDPLIKDVVRRSVGIWTSEDPCPEITERISEGYRVYVMRKWMFIAACIAATAVAVGYSVTIGNYHIPFTDVYGIIWAHLTGDVGNPTEDSIVFNLRLPRILIAIFSGMGLAVAGAVMQSTLMNPLADPYTTGLSSGAGLGATIAIVTGISLGMGRYGIVTNAFLFALIPMFVILFVSKIKNSSPTTMIMAGIAVMYIFNAFSTLLSLWAEPEKLQRVYEWTVGSLALADKADLPIMAVSVTVCLVVLQLISGRLDILSLGDENAKSLGVDAENLRMACLVIVTFLTASIVSFTGLIGFIGLVAPHIVRIVIGPDNRYLLPASAAFGAMFLVIADAAGRVLFAPAIIQVGVITAMLGGPLFLWLVLKRNSVVWG